VGEKGRAIQTWIRSVLHKIVDYKQQHRNLLTAATTILVEGVGLPQEIAINNILPCLGLPSYEFELEDRGKLLYCCSICVVIALLLKYPTRSASLTRHNNIYIPTTLQQWSRLRRELEGWHETWRGETDIC
jgi:hypothetical protein